MAVSRPGMTNVIDRSFGDRLREQIGIRGIAQAELARRLRVSPQAVSHWINDRSRPEKDTAMRLEDLLELPRGDLLRLLDYAVPGEECRTVSVEEALRADPTLEPEDKRAILRVLHIARERVAAQRNDPS